MRGGPRLRPAGLIDSWRREKAKKEEKRKVKEKKEKKIQKIVTSAIFSQNWLKDRINKLLKNLRLNW